MKKLIITIVCCLLAAQVLASNEIRMPNFPSGETLYAIIRNAAGQAWDPSDQAFENWPDRTDDGDSAKQYDISMTDKSADMYVGDFDSNISAGRYYIQIWLQDSTDPNEVDDDLVGLREIVWNGSAEEYVIDSSGRVDVGAVGGTAQTANDNGADINAILADTAAVDTTAEMRTFLTGGDTAVSTVTTAEVNAEVDNALNTAVLGSPTNNSINERIKSIDDKLPGKSFLAGSADADGGWDQDYSDMCKGAIWDAETSQCLQSGSMGKRLTDIFNDTAEIGAAGAGLTDLGGMSTTMKGQVNAEADTAISDAALATAAAIATIDTNVDAVLYDTGTTLNDKIDVIDTNVDDIETDTGTTLPATLSTMSTNIDDIETDTGTTLPATLATIDDNVDDVLVDTGTTLPAAISGVEGKVDTVDGVVDSILTDTAEIGAAGAGLTDLGGMSTTMKGQVNAEADTAISDAALATAANLATASTNIDAVLVDTAEIGAAGAGLTDLGGMSTTMKGQVNTEADTAISDAALATAANLATVDGNVDDIESAVGSPVALDSGAATLAGMLTKIADDNGGADFDATNDSLKGLRAWGDVNWGAGAGTYLLSTDVATGDTTTSFTMTDGVAADDAYNNGIIAVQDAGDSHWEARRISDYTSGKVITVDTAFSFPPAESDTVRIIYGMAMSGSGTTPAAVWAYGTRVLTGADNIAAPIADAVFDETATGHTDAGKAGAQIWTDIDAILTDTATTLPASLAAIDSDTGDILVDTGTSLPALLAVIGTNVDDIETDTSTTLPATLSSMDTNIDAVLVDTGTTLHGFIDTEIAAIKAVTDLFSFTGNDVKATLDGETTALSSTGLNNIPITDPAGIADTWPEMSVQLWRRFFKKIDRTTTQIRTYDDSGSNVRTTQTVSDDGTTTIVGAAQ